MLSLVPIFSSRFSNSSVASSPEGSTRGYQEKYADHPSLRTFGAAKSWGGPFFVKLYLQPNEDTSIGRQKAFPREIFNSLNFSHLISRPLLFFRIRFSPCRIFLHCASLWVRIKNMPQNQVAIETLQLPVQEIYFCNVRPMGQAKFNGRGEGDALKAVSMRACPFSEWKWSQIAAPSIQMSNVITLLHSIRGTITINRTSNQVWHSRIKLNRPPARKRALWYHAVNYNNSALYN